MAGWKTFTIGVSPGNCGGGIVFPPTTQRSACTYTYPILIIPTPPPPVLLYEGGMTTLIMRANLSTITYHTIIIALIVLLFSTYDNYSNMNPNTC